MPDIRFATADVAAMKLGTTNVSKVMHGATEVWPGTYVLPTTGLQLWLDAADASTFTYSSGTAVSAWNDKSGNGRHVTQGTVANQPNRNGSTNGRATVVFDGSTDRLTGTSWAMSKPVTMFVVARNTSAAATQRNVITFPTHGSVMTVTSGNITIRNNLDLTAAVAWGTTLFHQITGVFRGVQSRVFVDGPEEDAFGNAGPTAFTTGTMAVGSYVTAAEFWQGDIAEIIVYLREVSGTELADIQTYLKTKWGTP